MKYTKEQVLDIINAKVRGKIIPCHDEFGHHYKFVETGEIVDSVTTKNIMNKEHIAAWAVGLAIEFLEQGDRFDRLKGPDREAIITGAKYKHTDVRDEAGDVGTAAHTVIEFYINDWIYTGIRPASIMKYIPEGMDPRAIASVRCAENALIKEEVTPVACELLVGIPGISAGTLDLLVLDKNGRLWLYDWKTSNQMDIFYVCQTSAYRKFLMHMVKEGRKYGLYIHGIKIIKLDKFSNRPKIYNIPNMDVGYRNFLYNHYLYDWKNNGIEKFVDNKQIIRI